MDPRLWRAGRRLALGGSAFAAVTGAMAASPRLDLLLGAQDRVRLFLGAAALAAILPRLGRALMADRLTALHVHSAALACGLLWAVVAAMSAPTSRLGGLPAPDLDGPARVLFDNFCLLFEAGLLVTAVPADARDMARKWLQICRVLLLVAALTVAVSTLDAAPAWFRGRSALHDAAPARPDTEGRP